ncbi:GNAT family N-acetyltransferase [Anaeromicropila herbilytica]|uniref:Acetyltransferase n=1 Tax=Anaeromicropila herbilytica TaxID=2785025 RepID=A0A7R7EPN9_9FIRM|nr:GNAT family N-acetyltransferase [Anaeromicropila herbilytica]BCN32697.1 acetyltransferase [Anaeromicropila herbilytica]
MNEKYRMIKAYQKNDAIRKSFNMLTLSTWGWDFEDWYQNGYWSNNYIAYSIVDGERVVANVSISPMKFINKEKVMNFIQLGTVMTDNSYRQQGLIRELIKEIELDYKDKVDGYFLFANDSVLEFYPKFGYRKAIQYEYFKEINNEIINETEVQVMARSIPMQGKEQWLAFEDAIKASCIQNDLWLENNLELVMFYVTKFMCNNVYKVDSQDAYIIAEVNDGVLYIHQIFSPIEVDMEEIIAAFGKDIKKVILGFTPLSKEGFEIEEIKTEDTTWFIKGELLETLEKEHVRIPTLSHT